MARPCIGEFGVEKFWWRYWCQWRGRYWLDFRMKVADGGLHTSGLV